MDDAAVIAQIVNTGIAGVLLWRLLIADRRIAAMSEEIKRLNGILTSRTPEIGNVVAQKKRNEYTGK